MAEQACVVSNSEIGTWKECRRRWYLEYVRKLDSVNPPLGGPLVTGTLIHDGVETYYTAGEGEAGKDAARLRLALLWSEAIEGRDFVPPELKEAHDMATCVVEGYIEWLAEEGADSDLRVIEAEVALRAPSPVEGVDIISKLDLLVQQISTGRITALDHKSVGTSFGDVIKTLNLNWQAKVYDLMLRIVRPDLESDGMIWNLLRKSKRTTRAKPPFYMRYPIHHTDVERELFWVQMHGVISDMVEARGKLDAGWDHHRVCYPSPSTDCSWKCPFFLACGLMDDPRSDSEGFLTEHYEAGDPLKRYEGTSVILAARLPVSGKENLPVSPTSDVTTPVPS